MNSFVINHIKQGWIWTMLLAILPFASIAQTPLLNAYAGSLTTEQTAMVDLLSEQPTTKRLRVVEIDPAVFENPSIRFEPFDEISLVLKKQEIGHTGIKLRNWTGNFPSRLTSGAFVIVGKKVSGHVTGLDGNFEIFPLGKDGLHVLVEHDNEAFGGCGSEGESPKNKGKGQHHQHQRQDNMIHDGMNLGSQPINQPTNGHAESHGSECFIRVLVGYTSSAQTNTTAQFGRTMIEHVSLAVLESNQGYANSNVEQRMELAYLYETADNETSSASNDLDAMNDPNDGKWDEMHTLRNTYRADMVALITNGGYSGLCGRAFDFDYTDPENMYQVTEFDCATGNFTFAHEFGHNQGCRHDNDNTQWPFTYARGFNEGTNFRTIMAVCCNPVRVNFWSNPGINFQTFGSTGSATRDNARALDFGDDDVSHHRVAPAGFIASVTVADDHFINYFATSFVNSSNTAQSGSRIELQSFGVVRLQPGFHAQQGSSVRAWIQDECPNVSYAKSDGGAMAIKENAPVAPDVSVYPNPFQSQVTVLAYLPSHARVSIKITDQLGRLLEEPVKDGISHDGHYETTLNTGHLASGMYYIVIESEGMRTVQKVVKTQ